MKPLTQHSGLVAVLDRANVDTDQMVPKQFLKRIERTGFGQVLFFDWRYLGDGSANPDFELNQPRYQGASILVAGKNFGCGSSREHAPWALADYGFRVIIAPSFADIFWGNCFQNGMLPLALPEAAVREIMERAKAQVGYQLTVDLAAQTVTHGQLRFSFNVDPFRRHCLLNGLDDIGLTLQQAAAIAAYEEQLPAWRRVNAM